MHFENLADNGKLHIGGHFYSQLSVMLVAGIFISK